MSEQVAFVLLGAAMALLGSVVTAVVQHTLSIRREYSLRWWERKADVYSRIIENLAHWYNFCHGEVNQLRKARDTKDVQRLRKDVSEIREFGQTVRAISEAAAAGSYIISEDAACTLDALMGHIKEAPPLPANDEDLVSPFAMDQLIDYFANLRDLTRNCLQQVRLHAKADLRVD